MRSESDVISAIAKSVETKGGKNKASVPAKKMLDLLFGEVLPNPGCSFQDILDALDKGAVELIKKYNAAECGKVASEQRICEEPEQGSFNKCHGDWTEYICDVFTWNVLSELNNGKRDDEECFVYVKLPNRNGGKTKESKNVWTRLLAQGPQQLIENRRERLKTTENDHEVKLESSNPDAVILRIAPNLLPKELDPREGMTNIGIDNQKRLSSAFGKCKGLIKSSDQLVAFLSYKTSTRADRRYQWIVEGNSVKGLIATAFDDFQNPYKLGRLMRNKYFAFDLKGEYAKRNHEVLDGLIMFSSLFNESAIGRVFAIDGLYEPTTPAAYGDRIREICSK